MNFCRYSVLLMLVVFWSACSPKKKTFESVSDPVAGYVNGVPVTVEQFENAYIEFVLRTGSSDSRSNRLGVWNTLSDAILMAQWASENRLLPDDLESTLNLYAARRASREWLTESVAAQVKTPSEETKRRAYVRHKTSLGVRQLFFRIPTQADSFSVALSSGADFLVLANRLYKTNSFDSSAGLLSDVRYFEIDDTFAEIAYNLKLQEISKPFRTAHGWHIIRLEEIKRPPMLTEDAYEREIGGLEQLEFARIRRLKANETIQNIMEPTRPVLNPEAVSLLQELIDAVPGVYLEMEEKMISRSVSDYESGALPPEKASAKLAVWTVNGVERPYTIGDYWKWLPYLQLKEAKARIGVSIGRAMRNEMLAQKAVKEGYLDHPFVKGEKQRMRWMLGMKYALDELRLDSLNAENYAKMEEAFASSRFNRPTDFRVSYRIKRFKTLAEANAAWENGEVKIDATWEEHEHLLSERPAEWGDPLKNTPIGKPQRISVDDEVFLISIKNRTSVPITFQRFMASEGKDLWKSLAQVQKIRQLREKSVITLDTALIYKEKL